MATVGRQIGGAREHKQCKNSNCIGLVSGVSRGTARAWLYKVMGSISSTHKNTKMESGGGVCIHIPFWDSFI